MSELIAFIGVGNMGLPMAENLMKSGKKIKVFDVSKKTIEIAKEYKDVELSHMLADNCAMQLLRNPKQFDVIVTDNLFGDMLSDQASMLTGSLGLLPSASLGAKNKDGEMRAMYEPIHGSAPDIAGKGIANPIASILSFAMALRYSLDLDNEADALEKAVQEVLNDGLRTKDILSDGMKETSTSSMGDAIISKLQ
ncbi:isocitrate/isopropylmalate family dehydrogenase [Candidatus Pelagibacter sp.]|nr:isocitrate/isopropylmalate family dehydrogenase [Candidatus Pelagibacter sp.]